MVRVPCFRQIAPAGYPRRALVPPVAAGIKRLSRRSGGFMLASQILRTGVFAAAIAFAAAASAHAEAPSGRWLDAKSIVNWNKPGAAIPRGPKAVNPEMFQQCEKQGAEETKKVPPTPETRQVSAAGWRIAKVDKRAGATVVVFAFNGLDGMCRPLAYQFFVFVGGRFAGTLAPRPMHAREDGAGYFEQNQQIQARRFTAEFARYRESDALCCPSRTSTVTYEIRDAPGGGMLTVPVKVATKRNPQ
jgi:hypothetical protein